MNPQLLAPPKVRSSKQQRYQRLGCALAGERSSAREAAIADSCHQCTKHRKCRRTKAGSSRPWGKSCIVTLCSPRKALMKLALPTQRRLGRMVGCCLSSVSGCRCLRNRQNTGKGKNDQESVRDGRSSAHSSESALEIRICEACVQVMDLMAASRSRSKCEGQT